MIRRITAGLAALLAAAILLDYFLHLPLMPLLVALLALTIGGYFTQLFITRKK